MNTLLKLFAVFIAGFVFYIKSNAQPVTKLPTKTVIQSFNLDTFLVKLKGTETEIRSNEDLRFNDKTTSILLKDIALKNTAETPSNTPFYVGGSPVAIESRLGRMWLLDEDNEVSLTTLNTVGLNNNLLKFENKTYKPYTSAEAEELTHNKPYFYSGLKLPNIADNYDSDTALNLNTSLNLNKVITPFLEVTNSGSGTVGWAGNVTFTDANFLDNRKFVNIIDNSGSGGYENPLIYIKPLTDGTRSVMRFDSKINDTASVINYIDRFKLAGSGNLQAGDITAFNNTAQGSYIGLFKNQGSLPGFPTDYYPTLKTNHNALFFAANGTYVAVMDESSGDGNFSIYNSSVVSKINLRSNGNSYLNGGNVGIGTTNPSAKLQVYGTVKMDSLTNKYSYDKLTINKTTGEITALTLPHIHLGFENQTTAQTLTTAGTYYRVGGTTTSIFSSYNSGHGVDSIGANLWEFDVAAHWLFHYKLIFDGGTNKVFRVRILNITKGTSIPFSTRSTNTGTSYIAQGTAYCTNCSVGDDFAMEITSTSNSEDITLIDGSMFIWATHGLD
jgi:hypothetical protein